MRQIVYDALVEPIGPAKLTTALNGDWSPFPIRRIAASSAALAATLAFGGHVLAPIPVTAVAQSGQFSNVIVVRPALIYQASVVPETPPAVVTPSFVASGWSEPPPRRGLAPASQQFNAVASPIAVPATGVGDTGQFDNILGRPAVIYQAGVTPVRPIAPAAIVSGFLIQSPDLFVRPALAARLDFNVAPRFVLATPEGWRSALETAATKPLSAVQQQFQTFTRGSVPVGATSGWEGVRLDYQFARPVRAALQPFAFFQPAGAIATQANTAVNWQVVSPEQFIKPFAVARLPFDTQGFPQTAAAASGVGQPGSFSSVLSRPNVIYQAGVTPLRPITATATPTLGWNASSPAVVGFAINIGDGGELAGFVNYQPQGWWPDYPVQFAKTFPAALQQYSQFVGLLTTAPATATGVGDPGSFNSVLTRPGLIYQSGVTPVRPITAVSNSAVNWQVLNPERFVRPVLPQQFAAFQPQGAIVSTFPDGFRGVQWDVRFAKPVPAAAQAFASFQPFGTVVVVYPDGWRAPLETAFKKPFASAQQQFLALGSRPIPIVATPGWEGIRLEVAFAKPVNAAQQQFTGFLLGPPASPQGYASYQLNVAFAKPIAASQQQYAAFGRQVPADPPNTKVHGWQNLSPERFATSFPVVLQQYEARGHRRIPTITPVAPDGASGRRKPLKPVQPIWDRPQQTAKSAGVTAPATKTAAVATDAAPKTTAVTKPLTKDEKSILARQVLPAGPAIAPAAHATLHLVEDHDTMTAHAEWNDDHIALKLLLGDDLEDE